jgi:hypothetical protein
MVCGSLIAKSAWEAAPADNLNGRDILVARFLDGPARVVPTVRGGLPLLLSATIRPRTKMVARVQQQSGAKMLTN